MTAKVKLQYILLYLILNTLGIALAFKFWWTDSLILSGFNKYSLALVASVMICWLGIISLSIMVSRMILLKPDNFGFISPLRINKKEYFAPEIGADKAKKLKSTIPLIAFPVLIATIYGFIGLMENYQDYQLKENGIMENVTVKAIHKDVKGRSYVFFEYGNKKFSANLMDNRLKVNDNVSIIYSSQDPRIVKFND